VILVVDVFLFYIEYGKRLLIHVFDLSYSLFALELTTTSKPVDRDRKISTPWGKNDIVVCTVTAMIETLKVFRIYIPTC
jgi:hypothetical protein